MSLVFTASLDQRQLLRRNILDAAEVGEQLGTPGGQRLAHRGAAVDRAVTEGLNRPFQGLCPVHLRAPRQGHGHFTDSGEIPSAMQAPAGAHLIRTQARRVHFARNALPAAARARVPLRSRHEF
jgi:hypothetical protein